MQAGAAGPGVGKGWGVVVVPRTPRSMSAPLDSMGCALRSIGGSVSLMPGVQLNRSGGYGLNAEYPIYFLHHPYRFAGRVETALRGGLCL